MSKTIAALATPPGVSGIAVIRLSGTDSFAIIDKHFEGKYKISECKSHTIHYGIFKNEVGKIDTVLVSIFRGPNSYTGEDSIEISCHGGYIISGIILDNLFKSGAVAALPGEFTKRAFLNGKLDLSQVEAVADLIHSSSVPSAETSARQLLGEFNSRLAIFRKQLIDIASLLELELDFSEEDLELIDKNLIKSRINDAINFCKGLASAYKASEILRSGYFVAIVGYPNSGKSTLFNSLLQKQRAIVSSIAGTTRDYIEETSYINDIPIRFIDTAGIRETEDIIEIEGIKLVESVLEQSNLIVILNDYSISQNHSQKLHEELSQKYPNKDIVYTNNKIDESSNFSLDNIQNDSEKSNQLYISAKKQLGIEELKKFISNKASQSTESVNDILINKRHYDLLNAAMHSLENALSALDFFSENEIIAIDVRNACKILGELTGESYNEEVLNNIFGQFCIGK